jgi:hypothetical protein
VAREGRSRPGDEPVCTRGEFVLDAAQAELFYEYMKVLELKENRT